MLPFLPLFYLTGEKIPRNRRKNSSKWTSGDAAFRVASSKQLHVQSLHNKINTTQWGMKHPDPSKKKTVGNASLILKGFIGITPAKKRVLVTWSTFANVLVKSKAHFSLKVSIQQHKKKKHF